MEAVRISRKSSDYYVAWHLEKTVRAVHAAPFFCWTTESHQIASHELRVCRSHRHARLVQRVLAGECVSRRTRPPSRKIIRRVMDERASSKQRSCSNTTLPWVAAALVSDRLHAVRAGAPDDFCFGGTTRGMRPSHTHLYVACEPHSLLLASLYPCCMLPHCPSPHMPRAPQKQLPKCEPSLLLQYELSLPLRHRRAQTFSHGVPKSGPPS